MLLLITLLATLKYAPGRTSYLVLSIRSRNPRSELSKEQSRVYQHCIKASYLCRKDPRVREVWKYEYRILAPSTWMGISDRSDRKGNKIMVYGKERSVSSPIAVFKDSIIYIKSTLPYETSTLTNKHRMGRMENTRGKRKVKSEHILQTIILPTHPEGIYPRI